MSEIVGVSAFSGHQSLIPHVLWQQNETSPDLSERPEEEEEEEESKAAIARTFLTNHTDNGKSEGLS